MCELGRNLAYPWFLISTAANMLYVHLSGGQLIQLIREALAKSGYWLLRWQRAFVQAFSWCQNV